MVGPADTVARIQNLEERGFELDSKENLYQQVAVILLILII